MVHDALCYTINQQLQELKRQRREAREAREAAAAAAAGEGDSDHDGKIPAGEDPEVSMVDAAPANGDVTAAVPEEPEVSMGDAGGDSAATACGLQVDLCPPGSLNGLGPGMEGGGVGFQGGPGIEGGTLGFQSGTNAAGEGTAAPSPPVGPGLGFPAAPHVPAGGVFWTAHKGLGSEGVPTEVPYAQFLQPPVTPPGSWLPAYSGVLPPIPQVMPQSIIPPVSMTPGMPDHAAGLSPNPSWTASVPPSFVGGVSEGGVTDLGVGSNGTAPVAGAGQTTWQGLGSAAWIPPQQGSAETNPDLERIPSVTMMDADE